MTKFFVAGDLLSLTVQGNAAGLTGKKSTQVIGQWVVTAGLFIQLVIFGIFVVAAVVWGRRIRRSLRGERGERKGRRGDWQRPLNILYACSALITVRSVFRIVEYIMGVDGYLLSHEWPMYTFDGLLMFLVQAVFLIWFPVHLQIAEQGSGEDGVELVASEVRSA
jgi:hypothetical protein